MNFLPEDYKQPVENTGSRYINLKEGETKIRILTPAVIGYEWFVEAGDKKKPVRCKTWEEVPEEVKNAENWRDKSKHFWVFGVYDIASETLGILKITQASVQSQIDSYIDDEEWGNPIENGYTIKIKRQQIGPDPKEVEYKVIPAPKKEIKMSAEQKKEFESIKEELKMWFNYADYQAGKKEAPEDETVSADDIPF